MLRPNILTSLNGVFSPSALQSLQSRLLQSTLGWLFLTVMFLAGCSPKSIRPPDSFTPSLPPSPKLALFYTSFGAANAPVSWYESFEHAILQGLRDKGYDPVLVCGVLRQPGMWKNYVPQGSCPAALAGSSEMSHLAHATSSGDVARAAARDAAAQRGAASVLYFFTVLWVDHSGRYFLPDSVGAFVHVDELVVKYSGPPLQFHWWDLSYNWLQYTDPSKRSSASNSYPDFTNVENSQQIRKFMEASKNMRIGDRIPAPRFEPMEKFLKRLAGEIFKSIPEWIPPEERSSGSRHE